MKQQRPATAKSVIDGLKLHRHVVRSPAGAHTVITLRPGTQVRFSTNRFHDTWHVLSDDHGAQLLARLLWGLSYQARPGTVVLIDSRFLTPTPFDADPAAPIVLVPGWCTPFDDRVARHLKSRRPLPNPDGTIRWRTFGLDRTLEPNALDDWWDRHRHQEDKGTVTHRAGLLVLTPGSPDESRGWALHAARLDTANRFGTDHVYLGPWDRGFDGEIQVFNRFRPMVNVAVQARAQVLSRPATFTDPGALRAAVWHEAEHVRGDAHLRIRQWQGDSYTLGSEAAAMLTHAAVTTLDELAVIGAVEAYRRMRAAHVRGLNLEMLWAMEGALTYRDRRNVSAARRHELLTELGPEPAPDPIPHPRHRAPIRPSRSACR
ncbi:TfoX/Sxy family DNA transformation protein [Nocardia sp. NPDC004722]